MLVGGCGGGFGPDDNTSVVGNPFTTVPSNQFRVQSMPWPIHPPSQELRAGRWQFPEGGNDSGAQCTPWGGSHQQSNLAHSQSSPKKVVSCHKQTQTHQNVVYCMKTLCFVQG